MTKDKRRSPRPWWKFARPRAERYRGLPIDGENPTIGAESSQPSCERTHQRSVAANKNQ
jgi:hypothetical protein